MTSPLPFPATPRDATVLNLVALSGNVRVPSRTEALVRAVAVEFSKHVLVSQHMFSMAEIGPTVLPALTLASLRAEGLAYVHAIEAADILIIGSPIYRASYTDALKHLFDLVDYRALTGAIGVIVATGGTAMHGLATEHQFRPLLSFFGITAVSTTIYALENDFDGTTISSSQIRGRIEQAAAEAALLAPLAERRHQARRLAA